MIQASQLSHREQCTLIYASMVLHNMCVVLGETGGRTAWRELLGQQALRDGQLQDVELDHFYASYEKVMCAECRDALPQRVYCVHADRIAAEDQELAHSNGCRRGQRLPTIQSDARSHVRDRRDAIADALWEQFMEQHPGFSGQLSEFHLSSFRNE